MPRFETAFSIFASGVIAVAALFATPARADEYVDRANQLIGKIPDSRRSDLVVLPAIAKMDKPPEAISEKLGAVLLDASSPGWPSYAEWVNKPAQRATLEALAEVTGNNAYSTRMVFALPYGVEGVPPEFVEQDMYVELGDPPTLAAAKFAYLERLDTLWDCVAVEANRLLADGKPADALKVLKNALFFFRQIADRPSSHEKVYAMTKMLLVIETALDVVYRDSRSASPKLTPDELRDAIKGDAERDLLSIERIGFADYDRIAGEQLASKLFLPNGKINPATFAPTMSRVASGDRPLRLFSEAGYWERQAARHKGGVETKKAMADVANDFAKRWSLDQFDPYLSRPSDYETLGHAGGMSTVVPVYAQTSLLLPLRQRLRAEISGARMAMGVQAFVLKNKSLPPDFSAIRPAFVSDIETDPYLSGKKRMSYFVPIRDENQSGTDAGNPHEVRVFQMPEYPNFSSKLGRDQFVIYSAGPDQSLDWAHDATQANPEYKAGDFLLWPPRISLLRQYLTEQGLLK
jgi:hypothetical protein